MNARLIYPSKHKGGRPTSVDQALELIHLLEDASPGKFHSVIAITSHVKRAPNHIDNVVAGVFKKLERDVLEHLRRALRKHGLMVLGLERAIRDLGGKIDLTNIPPNTSPAVISKFKAEHENPTRYVGKLTELERRMVDEKIQSTPEVEVKVEKPAPAPAPAPAPVQSAPEPEPVPVIVTDSDEMTPRQRAFSAMVSLSRSDRTVVIEAITAYDKL